MSPALARPAVFGLADGLMSMLGVVLYLTHHPSLIFPAALSGGISSALSMAGGEWLSDSENGFGASCAMGAATGLGAILPALPYAFTTGPAAIAESVVICVMIGVAVAFLRPHRGVGLALLETFGVLAAIFAVVLLCGLLLPGSAALYDSGGHRSDRRQSHALPHPGAASHALPDPGLPYPASALPGRTVPCRSWPDPALACPAGPGRRILTLPGNP